QDVEVEVPKQCRGSRKACGLLSPRITACQTPSSPQIASPVDRALRDSGDAVRVMTASRWFFGILFLAGATAMMIIAQVAGPSAVIPLTMLVALAAAVGLSALSSLVVPLFARALGLFLRTRPSALWPPRTYEMGCDEARRRPRH